jgi:hypothetical protein
LTLRVRDLVLASFLVLAACDDDDAYQPDPPRDGGADAGRDGGADAGSSGSIDASTGLDASLGTGDAAPDAR